MRKPFIAGNWKMFKGRAETIGFARKFPKALEDVDLDKVDVAICSPYVQLETLKNMWDEDAIGVGAQNVHYEDEGAFTGELSVPMIEELGVDYCIIGHSERRQYFNETDEAINKKLHRLFKSPIKPILCIGESLEEREAGNQLAVIERQLEADLKDLFSENVADLVIAYEPIWAIGTGKTATPEQAQEMCKAIRDKIAELYNEKTADAVRIQYGGSVKPDNAQDILSQPDIDGALVGGASLKPDSFAEIVFAATK